MVALNYQTSSEPMWLNYGKFRDNGGCGYVLKPLFMRQAPVTFNPFQESTYAVAAMSSTVKKIDIEIISARQLPKPGGTTKGDVIDPFVTVNIHGLQCDTKSFRTATVKDNGFNPNWNETFVATLVCSELAMLMISIDDEDALRTNHVGHNASRLNVAVAVEKENEFFLRRFLMAFPFVFKLTVPVESLRSGVRSIPLYDDNNVKIPMCNLLCKITLHTASRTLSASK
jgi:hypothetical protein